MPALMKLGIGIIGCGEISAAHIKKLSEIPEARIAALCSRHPANAESRREMVREHYEQLTGKFRRASQKAGASNDRETALRLSEEYEDVSPVAAT